MQSDFSRLCAGARAQIAVPAVPLGAIRDAAVHRQLKTFKAKRFAAAATALFSAAALAAAAAVVVDNAHLTFTPSGGLVLSGNSIVTDRVSPANIAAIIRRADFPVTMPAGLPAGVGLKRIEITGSSVITLQYGVPGARSSDNHALYVFLANPKAMNVAQKRRSKTELRIHRRSIYRLEFWPNRGEEVTVVAKRAVITDAQLAAMKSSMERAAQH